MKTIEITTSDDDRPIVQQSEALRQQAPQLARLPDPVMRGLAPAISETAALMHMIERVARDPGYPIERLERLMEMYERVSKQQARTQFMAAMAAMQPELPTINEKGKIEIKAKDNAGNRTGPTQQATSYAKWADINEAIKPALGKHGFALSFRTGITTEGKITVTGILSHAAGHQEETTIILPHDSTGSKNAVQAIGSSTTYGQRYTARALLNFTSRVKEDGIDDDGNSAAGGNGRVSEEQYRQLIELSDSVGADKERFCRYFKIDGVAYLPAAKFQQALDMLNAKKKTPA